MANIGILGWRNETGLTPYPFVKSFGMDDVILDANFLQFDGFIPVLKTILVSTEKLIFNILFDSGLKSVEVSTFNVPHKIYDNTRYLGVLVFGLGAANLAAQYSDQLITVDVPFLAHTIKSIPGSAGVYSIAGKYGTVVVDHDLNIWYDQSGQNITFNSVALPATSNTVVLKTLNTTHPILNSVYIQETELIKITAISQTEVQFSLVGTSVSNLVDSNNSTIPTNPNP